MDYYSACVDDSEPEPGGSHGREPMLRQPDRLSVEVLDDSRRLDRGALAWLINHIQTAVRKLGGLGEIRIRIVEDEAMAAAHLEFAEVPGTTDVLTFDMSDPDDQPEGWGVDPAVFEPETVSDPAWRAATVVVLDVDLMLCIDEAERRGAAAGHTREKELLLYAVHGVLHCLGHDDHDEEAAGVMHRVEDAVLGAIGVGAVYAPGLAAEESDAARGGGPAAG